MALATELSIAVEDFLEHVNEDESPFRLVSYYEYCRVKALNKFHAINNIPVDTIPLYYARWGFGFE